MLRLDVFVIACIVVWQTIRTANAQERPAFATVQFNTSVVHRQNVCERQRMFDAREVDIRNALSGLALRPGVFQDEFFNLREDDGAIDPDDPGIIAKLLDELGRRGNFTWRDSFGVTVEPENGRTFTDLLVWTSNTYDMTADWYPSTVERLGLGINFQQKWYDSSLIMVQDQSEEKSKRFDVFSWFDPFGSTVWVLIVLTVLFSAVVYQGLLVLGDCTDGDYDHHQRVDCTMWNIFMTTIAFTGHFEYKPKTNPARLFTASLTFMALLVSSAYTANLASFLVFRNTPEFVINQLGDVVTNELVICVSPFTDARGVILKQFPFAERYIIQKETEADAFLGVRNGECTIAVSTMISWLLHEETSAANPDCSLVKVGEVIEESSGSFAFVSDSGTKCTSLIRDVLHLHMVEMTEEGVIDNLWKAERSKRKDISCPVLVAAEEEDGSGKLTLQDMGGIFVTHYILTGIAICCALFSRWTRGRSKTESRTENRHQTEDDDQSDQPRDESSLSSSTRCSETATLKENPSQNIHIDAVIEMLQVIKETRHMQETRDQKRPDMTVAS